LIRVIHTLSRGADGENRFGGDVSWNIVVPTAILVGVRPLPEWRPYYARGRERVRMFDSSGWRSLLVELGAALVVCGLGAACGVAVIVGSLRKGGAAHGTHTTGIRPDG
jgi:hypothetical protein